MSTLFALLALLLAGLSTAGGWWLHQQFQALRAEADQLRTRLDELGAAPLPEETVELPPGGRVIVVEILNPLELATEQTAAAGMLGRLAPSLVERIVYEQALKQLQERLAEEGVVADVRIHAAG